MVTPRVTTEHTRTRTRNYGPFEKDVRVMTHRGSGRCRAHFLELVAEKRGNCAGCVQDEISANDVGFFLR